MYRLIKNTKTGQIESVLKTSDNVLVTIPFDPDNTDYQAYLKWIEEGNTPEEAE